MCSCGSDWCMGWRPRPFESGSWARNGVWGIRRRMGREFNAVLENGKLLFYCSMGGGGGGTQTGGSEITQMRRPGSPGSHSGRGARKRGPCATLVGRPPETAGRGLNPEWLRQVGLRPVGQGHHGAPASFLLDDSGPFSGFSEALGSLSGAFQGPLGFSSGPLGQRASFLGSRVRSWAALVGVFGGIWGFLGPLGRVLGSLWALSRIPRGLRRLKAEMLGSWCHFWASVEGVLGLFRTVSGAF